MSILKLIFKIFSNAVALKQSKSIPLYKGIVISFLYFVRYPARIGKSLSEILFMFLVIPLTFKIIPNYFLVSLGINYTPILVGISACVIQVYHYSSSVKETLSLSKIVKIFFYFTFSSIVIQILTHQVLHSDTLQLMTHTLILYIFNINTAGYGVNSRSYISDKNPLGEEIDYLTNKSVKLVKKLIKSKENLDRDLIDLNRRCDRMKDLIDSSNIIVTRNDNSELKAEWSNTDATGDHLNALLDWAKSIDKSVAKTSHHFNEDVEKHQSTIDKLVEISRHESKHEDQKLILEKRILQRDKIIGEYNSLFTKK